MEIRTLPRLALPSDARFVFRMDVDDQNLLFANTCEHLLRNLLPEGIMDKVFSYRACWHGESDVLYGEAVHCPCMVVQAKSDAEGVALWVSEDEPGFRCLVEVSLTKDGRWFTVRCCDGQANDSADLIHECAVLAAGHDYEAQFKILGEYEACEW